MRKGRRQRLIRARFVSESIDFVMSAYREKNNRFSTIFFDEPENDAKVIAGA